LTPPKFLYSWPGLKSLKGILGRFGNREWFGGEAKSFLSPCCGALGFGNFHWWGAIWGEILRGGLGVGPFNRVGAFFMAQLWVYFPFGVFGGPPSLLN